MIMNHSENKEKYIIDLIFVSLNKLLRTKATSKCALNLVEYCFHDNSIPHHVHSQTLIRPIKNLMLVSFKFICFRFDAIRFHEEQ